MLAKGESAAGLANETTRVEDSADKQTTSTGRSHYREKSGIIRLKMERGMICEGKGFL